MTIGYCYFEFTPNDILENINSSDNLQLIISFIQKKTLLLHKYTLLSATSFFQLL